MYPVPCLDTPAAASVPETTSTTPSRPDEFFPSGRFARVPAEALGPLAQKGPHRMSHAEFRLFVALCRFRGLAHIVNPCQETLASMTGIARQNVSRTAASLQAKGWVRVHHEDDHKQKRVENYELLVPTPGQSPGVEPKPRKPRVKHAATTPAVSLRSGPMVASKPLPDHLQEVDCAEFDAMDAEATYTDCAEIDAEPMTAEELELAMRLLEADAGHASQSVRLER